MPERVIHEVRFVETDDGFRIEVKGDKERMLRMGFGPGLGYGPMRRLRRRMRHMRHHAPMWGPPWWWAWGDEDEDELEDAGNGEPDQV